MLKKALNFSVIMKILVKFVLENVSLAVGKYLQKIERNTRILDKNGHLKQNLFYQLSLLIETGFLLKHLVEILNVLTQAVLDLNEADFHLVFLVNLAELF